MQGSRVLHVIPLPVKPGFRIVSLCPLLQTQGLPARLQSDGKKLKGRAMAACVVDITIWTGSICARSTILAPGNERVTNGLQHPISPPFYFFEAGSGSPDREIGGEAELSHQAPQLAQS
jgi:hypothetical protein